MGHKVLTSLENAYGDYCVDIFLREDGTYGFEEHRRDPEDGGRWYSLNKYSGRIFETQDDAIAQARASVVWLRADAT
jgi:hypothetical protein